MAFKTSYSQSTTYVSCPKYWDNSYNQKLKSEVESASLYFGSAIDAAVMAMLEGKTDYLYTFKDRWKNAFQFGKKTPIYDSQFIVYSNNDFDPDVDLTKAKCNAVASKKYWLETFDWYLQPLDEKEYLKDELIKFCNTFNMNNTSEKIVNEYLNNK